MALSFPTGSKSEAHIGYPLHPEARHMCHCGAQRLLDELGSCMRCGRYPAATIAETWEQRKRHLATRR